VNVSTGVLALLILLVAGTTARLTRLVTKDSITEPLRAGIEKKAKANLGRNTRSPDDAPGPISALWRRIRRRVTWTKIDDLLTCPWCVSVYVAVPVSFIVVWSPTNRFLWAGMIACTASLLTGHLQTREYDPLPDQANSIEALVRAGFTRASSADAVEAGDLSLLVLADRLSDGSWVN